jgi:ABC-2 type transport system ATP-binding protein
MSVKVESVTKLYGKQKALDNLTFEVKTGEIVGILGPNGAGKSTLMKIITGFLQPEEGNVSINGLVVGSGTLEIKQQIGYLPENNPLYLDLYVAEYLEYVAGIYRLKKVKPRVAEMISLTGLENEKHKKIGALSKGYRQRVGIAQALIHDPAVLILDEPTSGLDPSQIVEIRQLIKNVSSNKTVMLSTHILQEAEAMCDRIMIINQGKIIATDTPINIKSYSINNLQNVLIEFTEQIDPNKLLDIQGVKEIKALSGTSFLVSGTDTDLRPILFKFAVDNHLTLLTLNKQESSLENVFLQMVR